MIGLGVAKMSKKERYYVQPCTKDDYAGWLLKKHYAHRIPHVMFAFGLYTIEKSLCGICTFGMPPCQMNYGSGIFKDYHIDTFELNRLIINDNHEKNLTSFFVSQSIKQMPKPSCLVSFADPNKGHHGYIYQATNWIYTGLTQKGGKDKQWILNNREYHAKTITIKYMKELGMEYNDSLNMTQNWTNNGGMVEENVLRKHRYLFFNGSKQENKKMKNALLLSILPYPKGDNKNYDTSCQISTQNLLF